MIKLKKKKSITYEEIVMNELLNLNDWYKLCSEYELDLKTIQEFKEKIYWDLYFDTHLFSFKYLEIFKKGTFQREIMFKHYFYRKFKIMMHIIYILIDIFCLCFPIIYFLFK